MSPLWQLFLMRMRSFWREPGTLFWVFAFPLLTSLGLGVAFRQQGAAKVHVGVVSGTGAPERLAQLRSVEGLDASEVDEVHARQALRQGDLALVVLPGEMPTLLFDPVRPEGPTARLAVLRALESRSGLLHELPHREQPVIAPGSRYLDFLIPGMLGLNLMSSGIWGLGYALVQLRKGKLLKRLAATPMRRTDFLFSFLLSRLVLAVVEVLFFALFASLLFGVKLQGSLGSFLAVGLIGAMTFAAMALLVGCRAENTETANGLANLIILPMMLLSGVFFSVTRFPGWLQPVISLLPLTALNAGLRAVMNDGWGLAALGPQLLVLAAWGVISFLLALRLFRWA